MFLHQKAIVNRFKADNLLLHAIHDSPRKNEKREKFINDLRGSPDFVKTVRANEYVFRDSVKRIVKNFRLKDYMLILCLTLLEWGLMTATVQSDADTRSFKTDFSTQNILLITISVLFFLGLVTTTRIMAKRADKEEQINLFYYRTIIRLYRNIVKLFPNLKDNNIYDYCPEMLRVISTLLIANMSKSDTDKIAELALSVEKLSNLQDEKDIIVIKDIERKIKSAIQIVEKCFYENPDLYRVVVDAYSGKVPTTFVLNQNQNVK